MRNILAILSVLLFASNARAEKISPWALDTTVTEGTGLESPTSAYNLRQKYSELDFSLVRQVASFVEARRIFDLLRDHRGIFDPSRESFMRRTTWLWANDGCFVRSAYMTRLMGEREALPLTQFFVFGGDILAKPEWREGWEYGLPWTYHVAPVLRVGSAVYVLDPAVDQNAPLEISDWLSRFVQAPADMEVTVCGPHAFGPNEECWGTHPLDHPEGMAIERWNTYFFDSEWRNVTNRGFDPFRLLGDFPPWRAP